MSLTPLKTLPLRGAIKAERWRNARELRRAASTPPRGAEWRAPGNLVGLTAQIDPYPDLGHQLSTWVSGYLWARDLKVPYFGGLVTKDHQGLFDLPSLTAAAPGKRTAERRLAATGYEYETWALPALQASVDRAENGAGRPWVGRLALDQRRWDQTAASVALRRALLGGYLGGDLRAAESGPEYIAIHARRGDIGPDTHPDRWLDATYYERLLGYLRRNPRLAQMPVRLYTSGDVADLRVLERVGVQMHDSGDRDHDLVAIAAARLIVAAPSSFGFVAALASRAPVIARVPWWHHVPDTGRWFAYDPRVGIDANRLTDALPNEEV